MRLIIISFDFVIKFKVIGILKKMVFLIGIDNVYFVIR